VAAAHRSHSLRRFAAGKANRATHQPFHFADTVGLFCQLKLFRRRVRYRIVYIDAAAPTGQPASSLSHMSAQLPPNPWKATIL
jgi:hypothetical protein